MTKRKLTKYEDDVRRGLRKSAEINPAQSPHNGIHTWRDTIEEQNAQIEGLKRDLLEKTAAVRNLQMGGQCEKISRLKAEAVNLKEVIAELRISAEDDLHSIESARIENTRLKAEVERLRNLATKIDAYVDVLVLKNGWLRKAGDNLERVLTSRSGSYEAGNASHEWQSAKNYKPSV